MAKRAFRFGNMPKAKKYIGVMDKTLSNSIQLSALAPKQQIHKIFTVDT
jgi:hypothetical protein